MCRNFQPYYDLFYAIPTIPLLSIHPYELLTYTKVQMPYVILSNHIMTYSIPTIPLLSIHPYELWTYVEVFLFISIILH